MRIAVVGVGVVGSLLPLERKARGEIDFWVWEQGMCSQIIHLYASAVGTSERDISTNLLADLVINESDPKPMELDEHESL